MGGPFPRGVACVAVSHSTLLFQYWEWAWWLLMRGNIGARYRIWAVRRFLELHPRYANRDIVIYHVPLGEDWPA
jgi:hypothetical protein